MNLTSHPRSRTATTVATAVAALAGAFRGLGWSPDSVLELLPALVLGTQPVAVADHARGNALLREA